MPSLSALKNAGCNRSRIPASTCWNSSQRGLREAKTCGFPDVKRAHFYSDATTELYVELPAEAKKPGEDLVGKLLKSLYGTRDAPLNWELQIRKVMIAFHVSSKARAIPAFISTQAEICEQ